MTDKSDSAAASGRRRRPGLWLPVVLGLLFLPAVSSWQAEFRVHSYVVNDQTAPALATDGSGRFLAVWVSERQDEELTGIFARLFSSYGVTQGPEFQVNVNWEHLQEKPFVAAGPEGRYIITWYNYGWMDIAARIYDNNGIPLTGEFIVNEQSWAFKGGQTAAMDRNGGFIVVWHAHGYESGLCHVYARLFDPYGIPLGPQFRISRDGGGDQMNPAVAMHRDGHFTVVWTRFSADGLGADIIGRRFSRTGLPLENEFFVSGSAPGRRDQARLVMDTSGAFVVCWHAHTYTQEAYNILARRFSPMAFPLGGEFIVNSHRDGWQVFPSIAFGDAGYLVTWQSFEQDGDDYGIFAAILDRDGASRVPEFQVNSMSQGRQERPAGVFLTHNRIAVAWQDLRVGATDWDVYAAISDVAYHSRDGAHVSDRDKIPPSKIK